MMYKFYRFLVGITLILMSIPLILVALIKLEVDVFFIRDFLITNTYVFLIYFIISGVLGLIVFRNFKIKKRLIIVVLSIIGLFIYSYFYDTILPY